MVAKYSVKMINCKKIRRKNADMSNDKLFKKIVAENRKGYLARINL